MNKNSKTITNPSIKDTVKSSFSSNQINYIKKYKRQKFFITFTRIFIFIAFISLWEIASSNKWIDSFIFSSPRLIGENFLEMLNDHSLLTHISITLAETFISFLLVISLGSIAAIVLWAFPNISKILEPYLVILNSLPKSALAPLLIVWLGANMRTIIVAGVSVAIFGSIINLYTGFHETDQEKLKMIQTFGGNKFQQLTKIVLPSSIPLILSTMKVNIGLCLVGVIIGEFIGARQGLGYLIIYGSQTFKLTWVLMAIVILCVIAMGLYSILNFVEKIYLRQR